MLKEKGFTPIVFIFVILVLSVGIVGGSFYIKSNDLLSKKGLYNSQSVKQAVLPSLNPVVTSQTPQPTIVSQITPLPSLSSTDKTANWEIYTDTEYNFSIKYPKTSNISKDLPNAYLINLPAAYGNNSPIRIGLLFEKTDHTASETADLMLNALKVSEKNLNNKIEKSRFNLNGIIAEKLVDDNFIDKTERVLVFISNNKGIVYQFSVWPKEDNKDQILKIFDQILSTFKFTN